MEEDSSLGWAPMAPEEMDFSAFSTTFPTGQFTADHTQQLEAAPAAVMAQLPTQPVPVQQAQQPGQPHQIQFVQQQHRQQLQFVTTAQPQAQPTHQVIHQTPGGHQVIMQQPHQTIQTQHVVAAPRQVLVAAPDGHAATATMMTTVDGQQVYAVTAPNTLTASNTAVQFVQQQQPQTIYTTTAAAPRATAQLGSTTSTLPAPTVQPPQLPRPELGQQTQKTIIVRSAAPAGTVLTAVPIVTSSAVTGTATHTVQSAISPAVPVVDQMVPAEQNSEQQEENEAESEGAEEESSPPAAAVAAPVVAKRTTTGKPIIIRAQPLPVADPTPPEPTPAPAAATTAAAAGGGAGRGRGRGSRGGGRGGGGAGRAKKEKDPNAPAVAHTAYKFFYKETAQNVKNHNPGVKFGDVSRIVGEMWGTLTDAEKEKYRKMAAEDKIRYANELEEYKSEEQQGLEGGAAAVNNGEAATAGSTTTTTQPEEEDLSSSLNSSVQIQEDEDDEVSFKNNHVDLAATNVFTKTATTPSVVNTNKDAEIDPSDVTEDTCIRVGCNNFAVRNPEWEGEYCSNECVVMHCKNVFTAYTRSTMAEHLANNTSIQAS